MNSSQDGSSLTLGEQRQEFRRLVEFAEKLQEEVEASQLSKEGNERKLLLLFIITSYLFAILAWLITTSSNESLIRNPLIFLVILFLVLGGGIYVFFAWRQTRSRDRMHTIRNERALQEVVQLIREIEAAIPLSTLERAEIRIRLSRLDIGFEKQAIGELKQPPVPRSTGV